MRRQAILIGNAEGLSGVKIDIANFEGFLTSATGGAWRRDEIKTLVNPSRNSLMRAIAEIKGARPDYVITYFSGHGLQRRETTLIINEYSEAISEGDLSGLAERQLSIYDCCRAREEEMVKASSMDHRFDSIRESYSEVRIKFDSRIMQAIPQHAKLYSCSVGQYSYDTNRGGIYTGNLLAAARNITRGDFKLVGVAHDEATLKTVIQASLQRGEQAPDHWLPKCSPDRSLIISVR
jgi:hypothetical protein